MNPSVVDANESVPLGQWSSYVPQPTLRRTDSLFFPWAPRLVTTIATGSTRPYRFSAQSVCYRVTGASQEISRTPRAYVDRD